MNRMFWKLMFALLASIVLAACAELDLEGRGRVVVPPAAGQGPNVDERRHADDRDDEGDKEKHKHKKKEKKHKDDDDGDDDDDDDDDDDGDGDEHHHGKHHKD